MSDYLPEVQENARVLNKQYEEIPGSLDFFKKLFRGPYTTGEFLFLKPGQAVTQKMFLSETAGCQPPASPLKNSSDR